jgi:hypothetical protein
MPAGTVVTDLQLVRRLVAHVGRHELSDFEWKRLVIVMGEIKRGARLSTGQRALYEKMALRLGVRDAG